MNINMEKTWTEEALEYQDNIPFCFGYIFLHIYTTTNSIGHVASAYQLSKDIASNYITLLYVLLLK